MMHLRGSTVQYSHRVWGTCETVRLIEMCLNKTYSKVGINKYLPDSFPVQNGLKQRYALSILLFNSALEYAIRIAQQKQGGTQIKWDVSPAGLY
jgi:hypothetical protein